MRKNNYRKQPKNNEWGETFLSHCSIHQNRFAFFFWGLIMFVNFKQKKGSYNCSLGNQLTIFCVFFKLSSFSTSYNIHNFIQTHFIPLILVKYKRKKYYKFRSCIQDLIQSTNCQWFTSQNLFTVQDFYRHQKSSYLQILRDFA